MSAHRARSELLEEGWNRYGIGGGTLHLEILAQETDRFLRLNVLQTTDDERGQLAICAAIYNEGRFISEWLIYNRLIGIDTFYLYDTGSTDDTLEVLAPWIDSGVVVLHQFADDQGGKFQISALRSCSQTYASKSEWIIEADTDEFYVPTRAFTGVSLRNDPSIYECPIRPLPELLKNFIYKSADAIGVARVTFKNNGIVKLDDDASVLASQTMRDVYHAIPWAKLFFTKSLVHTKKKSGWIIPWAHGLKHVLLAPSQVKIINVVGEPAPGLVMNDPTNDNPGTLYEGKLLTRAFEPLVLYHYVQRDLTNCLTKLARASVVRKGGWRDTAGEEGCKDYEMYQDKDGSKEIFETNSFYAAATQDFTMADSCIGRHLPALIRDMRAVITEFKASGKEPKNSIISVQGNPGSEDEGLFRDALAQIVA